MSRATIVGRHVPAGGAATINGVLYQMLWTLLHASRATFVKPSVIENNQLQEVTLVLEPAGGGGDLVVQADGRRSVEQLKARPDGRTWSLREVVEKVIPDLYVATLNNSSPASYRFVTEGRMGRWKEEYQFFHSIQTSHCPQDPLSDIDDTVPLKTAKRQKDASTSTASTSVPFWEQDSYTARQLFVQIVTEVRNRQTVSERETEVQTQRGLRLLLANFEFVGDQFMEHVQKEIDSNLLAIVAQNDDIPLIRDSLAMELARLATQGDVEVECREVFRKVGIDAIPLTDWARIRRKTRVTSNRYLQILGYESSRDVRIETAKQLINFWPEEIPILAIAGESGSGKSWRAYAICDLAQHGESLCMIVQAGTTADDTLNRAASRLWQEVAGHDTAIPLSQIANRVGAVMRTPPKPWLTLVIDGAIDNQQLRDLILQPWEDWGIRLVVTVSQRASALLPNQSKERCKVSSVETFNTRELHNYLAEVLGDKWPDVPDFVREILKVPILADLYRQIVVDSGHQTWNPQSEYDMCNKFWTRAQALEPSDSDILVRLGEKFLLNGADCWPIREVKEAGADNATITRLEQAGWLRTKPSITGISVEFVHLRLLNWACAIVVVTARSRNSLDLEELRHDVLSFFKGASPKHGHKLGYVAMDVLWLMCQLPHLRNEVPAVVASLEGDYNQTKALYEHLLPTLGSTVIDGLLSRLRSTIDDWFVPSLIATSLAKVGGDAVIKAALVLLADENPFLQLSACDVFAKYAASAPLDELWRLHNACRSTPGRFLREKEKHNVHILRNRTYSALRTCCGLSPDWLAGAIERADPKEECVADLAYLLCSLEQPHGERLWRHVKSVLFAKISTEDYRALAVCIDRFSDKTEIQWLTDSLDRENFIGVAAAKALARFCPLNLIEQLHRVPPTEILLVGADILDLLFLKEAITTRRQLIELMSRSENPWTIAKLYYGRTHYMDVETLEMLLRNLDLQLESILSAANWGETEPLFRELQLLAQIQTKTLLQCLRRQCGTRLESMLTKFVLRIGKRSWDDNITLPHAEAVLLRIGGDGFTDVVNAKLRTTSGFVRLEAIRHADWRPTEETFSELANITEGPATLNFGYIEQCHAAVILALHGRWDRPLAFLQAAEVRSIVRTADFPSLTDLPRLGFRPPATALKKLSEQVLSSPSGASPGLVLALGFGPPDFGVIIRRVADCCDPESELALACVVALEMLRDNDPENVDFLCGQLAIKPHQFSATNALIMNGSQRALEALESFAGGKISDAIAINLVRHSSAKQRVVEMVCATVRDAVSGRRAWGFVIELHRMIEGMKDEAVAKKILSQHVVEDYLRVEAFADEGNAWFTGSKSCAISCLSYIDPSAALVAAKAALQNTARHDRDFYPAIIARLDPEGATDFFMQLLITEGSQLIRKSIGRAMYSLNAESQILNAITSCNAETQVAGCYSAGWFRSSTAITDQLVGCLNSMNVMVSRAAMVALSQLSIRNECSALSHGVMETGDTFERWLYLDCLLRFSDCGNDHTMWPVGGPAIGDVFGPLQLYFVTEQLRSRREKERQRPPT